MWTRFEVDKFIELIIFSKSSDILNALVHPILYN